MRTKSILLTIIVSVLCGSRPSHAQSIDTGGGDIVNLQIERSVQVNFQADPTIAYQVYSSTDLGPSKAWQPLGDSITGATGKVSFFYNVADDQKVFFKVVGQVATNPPPPATDLEVRVTDLENKMKLVFLGHLNLSELDLSGMILTNAYLRNANLTNAILVRANLANSDLSQASLVRANLGKVDLTGANLNSANLLAATLTNANLTGANLTGAKDFSTANFSGAIFKNTIMPDGTIRTDP